MHDEQPLRQHFTALEQVAQISAAEPLTGRALTAFFNRAIIGLVLGIHNVQDAVMREQMTVTRVAGRHNAVEEINAASDTFNNVARCADTHQVARLMLGRMRQNNIENMVHDLGAFTDGKTANGITRQIQLRNCLHMLDTQVVISAALIDTEQQLVRVYRIRKRVQTVKLGFTAFEPARGTVNGVFNILTRRGVLDTLVERHRNVRAEVGLDAHALLRSHENLAAVNVRVKGYAFLLDLAQGRQRKHLKAAGVGQHRTVPAHEFVQTAHLLDDLVTRTDVQMIGVRQLNLAAQLLEIECVNRTLDRTRCADILEYRRLYHAMCRTELAATGAALGFD